VHLAGHRRPRDRAPEAEPGVLPDLGRRPRGAAARARPAAATGVRLVLPVLPRPGPAARPRREPLRHPPPGRRLLSRPGVGRSPDAVALGRRRTPRRHPVEPDGQPVHPAVGCAEAARYISRRPGLPGLHGRGGRAHLREPRGGRHERGRVLGEPEHRLHAAPPGAVRGGRQRLRHLRPVLDQQSAPVPSSSGLPGPRRPPHRRDRLLRGAGAGAAAIARVRASEGPPSSTPP
jgi:hypothetical protein